MSSYAWVALAAAWYFGGAWLAIYVWRSRFDLELLTLLFVAVFAIAGPLIGLVWWATLWVEDWLEARGEKPPLVIWKRRSPSEGVKR